MTKLGNDVSNGLSLSNCNAHNNENGKNWENMENQPYTYELFAIMIHSGSASGGHYYAYIKDFENQEWLCFNDQCVNKITQDDINTTYGGGSTRAYFSSAYSSSTNAYMLMYRQIDRTRNCLPMSINEFPEHIKKLLCDMRENEKKMALSKIYTSVKVFCQHPKTGSLENHEVSYRKDLLKSLTWERMARLAYEDFELEKYASIEQCRLVGFYAWKQENILRTYDPKALFEDPDMQLLLQIRAPDEPFYDVLDLKIYVVTLEDEIVAEEPMQFSVESKCTVKQLKEKIAEQNATFHSSEMHLVLQEWRNTRLLRDDKMLEEEKTALKTGCKIYASSKLDFDPSKTFEDSMLERIVEKYEHAITVKFSLPCTSQETLTVKDIPLLEQERDEEKVSTPILNGDASIEKSLEYASSHKFLEKDADSRAQLTAEILEQCNSEDSSLSDSDKTLVGDNLEQELIIEDMATSQNPLFNIKDTNDAVFPNVENESNNVDESDGSCRVPRPATLVKQSEEEKSKCEKETSNEKEYLFKCLSWEEPLLKLVIDERMPVAQLKKRLEKHLKISSEYFKICPISVKETHRDLLSKDEISEFENKGRVQTYQVKLYRPVKSNEFQIMLYQLILDSPEPYKYICDLILERSMTAVEAKKKIAVVLKQQKIMDQCQKPECLRIRKKNHKSPCNVLGKNKKLSNIQSLCVQILPEKETFTCGSTAIFLKRWYPSKMSFGKFEEVILSHPIHEIMPVFDKISEVSQIPVKNLQIMFGNEREFPCDMNVTTVHEKSQWISYDSDTEKMFDTDNSPIIFYRDTQEALKDLNDEEKRQLEAKENKRLENECGSQSSSGNSGLPGSYAPRREKVLKIHVVPKSTC